mmetsp:Transcript_26530/g.36674  ORF Transcript_26530/g.36674 Transcript_26530/m.36674 type:complete len:381 (-) Transcript_26530:207-1349(-)
MMRESKGKGHSTIDDDFFSEARAPQLGLPLKTPVTNSFDTFRRYREVSCSSHHDDVGNVRVLFIHGMQADPNQYKAQVVAEAGFNLLAPDMGTKWLCLGSLFAFAAILALIVVLGHTVYERTRKNSPNVKYIGWTLYAIFAIISIYLFNVANAYVWHAKFHQCVKQMRRNILDHSPHAIVASSFGAAVTVELMNQGHWRGATILLSPAVDRVHRMIVRGGPDSSLPNIPAVHGVGVSIIHGHGDWIAPFKDSLRLFSDSKSVGQFIDAGRDGHFLSSWNDPMDMLGLVCDTIEFAAAGQRLSPMKTMFKANSGEGSPMYSFPSKRNNVNEKNARASNELGDYLSVDDAILKADGSSHCNSKKAVWPTHQKGLQRRTVRAI